MLFWAKRTPEDLFIIIIISYNFNLKFLISNKISKNKSAERWVQHSKF